MQGQEKQKIATADNNFCKDIEYLFQRLLEHPIFIRESQKLFHFKSLYERKCQNVNIKDRESLIDVATELTMFFEDGHTNIEIPYTSTDRLLLLYCDWEGSEQDKIIKNDLMLSVNYETEDKQLMYVGDFYEIVSTGDVIYIGSDLPNEYSGSKYTHSLKGTNAKAKANASQGIPEMLEIAIGKHFRDNNEEKHWRNAKFGWYRYDSRFALPVYSEDDEIERYNVFHASLIVRHSEDKKLYLYDIIDIKKETSNSIEP